MLEWLLFLAPLGAATEMSDSEWFHYCRDQPDGTDGCVTYRMDYMYIDEMCMHKVFIMGDETRKIPIGSCHMTPFEQSVTWECTEDGMIEEKVYFDLNKMWKGGSWGDCSGEPLETKYYTADGSCSGSTFNGFIRLTTDLCSRTPIDPCGDVVCPAVVCPDGSEPPLSPGECCGDVSKCPDSCANVLCIAVVCPDGSEPPVPPGGCCGDVYMCPDPCGINVLCPAVVCPDGSQPPVPPGGCCGDVFMCPDVCHTYTDCGSCMKDDTCIFDKEKMKCAFGETAKPDMGDWIFTKEDCPKPTKSDPCMVNNNKPKACKKNKGMDQGVVCKYKKKKGMCMMDESGMTSVPEDPKAFCKENSSKKECKEATKILKKYDLGFCGWKKGKKKCIFGYTA